MSVESPHKDTKKHLKVCICRLYKFYKKKKGKWALCYVYLLSLRVYSHLSWIESNSSSFPPLVWIFWTGIYSYRTLVRTKQPYRDPAEEVVSVRFQTNSGTVEWMTLAHGFCLQFLVHLQKRAVWKRTTPNKNFLNQPCIWSGPKQVN